MPKKKYFFLLTVALLSLIFINCSINDIFRDLGKYSRAVQTQESKTATKTAYQATLTYLESLEDPDNAPEPLPAPSEAASQEMPSSAGSDISSNASKPEPISGLTGKWDYISATEAREHLYTMTITWDGLIYKVTDCTYVYKDGVCQVQDQSWDGITFSFRFYFPHTGYSTFHTISGVSGDMLTGIRNNEQHGIGDIVWSRSN